MDGEKRILVIDDEEIVRELISDALSDAGFQVTAAEDGRRGVDCFCLPDSRYDIVIVDMSMPGMDGIEVCTELKSLNPAQKIMVATGNIASEEAEEELRKLGIDQILQKPFNLTGLLSQIGKTLA